MNISKFTNFVTPAINMAKRVMFKVNKASPEILLAGGIIIGGVAIISACNASRHLDDILDDTKDNLDILEESNLFFLY